MLMLYFIIHLITVNYNKHNNSSHDRINNIMFLPPGKIKSRPIIILWYFFNNKIHKKKNYIYTGPCTNPYKRVENIIWYYNVKKKMLHLPALVILHRRTFAEWTQLLLLNAVVMLLLLFFILSASWYPPFVCWTWTAYRWSCNSNKKKTKFLEKNKCI